MTEKASNFMVTGVIAGLAAFCGYKTETMPMQLIIMLGGAAIILISMFVDEMNCSINDKIDEIEDPEEEFSKLDLYGRYQPQHLAEKKSGKHEL